MNLKLLRKATPDDLKVGDRVLDTDGDTGTLVAPSHPVTGEIVLSYGDAYGYYVFRTSETVYLPPLCWVEDKPVYKGDVLYWTPRNQRVVIQSVGSSVPDALRGEDNICYQVENLTWTEPKTKREGWLNIYPTRLCGEYLHPTEADANRMADDNRRACIKIEWEE